MSTKKILRKVVKNGVEMHLPQNNVFVITEDKLTKTTTATKGVAPYNTDYYYTNYQISATAGVKWIEGALYTFMINTKTTASAYRNVRVQIGTGSYIPVMSSSGTILGGSSYFTKANDRIYQYSTRYESGGALHLITDSNTTYSSMSAAEGQTGTATSARSLTAANLKAIIEYHAGNLHDSTKANKTDVLQKDNTDSYTPSENYHPATKKYVDDAVAQAGGGVDENTMVGTIYCMIGDYDNMFKISEELYVILNNIDDEDNLGLIEGDSRDDIVANSTSMSKISHSYAVMGRVAGSEYALSKILDSVNATKEVSECWNSALVLANNKKSRELYLNSENGLNALDTYQTARDAFFGDESQRGSLIYQLNDSVFSRFFLENESRLDWTVNNSNGQDRINQMSPDDLLPSIFYRTELSGYDTFEDLVSSNDWNTVKSSEEAMSIINCNSEAKDMTYAFEPTTNTVLYMPLNGDVLDYSGQNNNGSRVGTSEYKTIGNKQYAYFNDNSYINLSSFPINYQTSIFTQVCWVKTNSSGYAVIHRIGYDANQSRSLLYVFYTNGRPLQDKYGVDVYLGDVAPSSLFGKWIHVVYTYSNNTHKLYINGELYGTASSSFYVNNRNNKSIGMSGSGATAGYGLSECIMEKRLWEIDDIKTHFNGTKRFYGY